MQSRAGANLQLGFDPAKAILSRSGNDLVLLLEDGGVVVLTAFFAVGDSPLPHMTLPDGMVLPSSELFKDVDFDVSTAAAAARPAPRPPAGSGIGEYRTETGELLSSVETLQSLAGDLDGASDALGGALLRSVSVDGGLSGSSSLTSRPGGSDGSSGGEENPTPPSVVPMNLTDPFALNLRESGLARGTQPGAAKVDHKIDLPAGYSLDTEGWTREGEVFSTVQGNFKLTYAPGTNELRYEIIAPFDHPDPNSPNEELASPARISLNLIGPGGSRTPAYIDVQVQDDAPEASIAAGREQLKGLEGEAVEGAIDMRFGADGKHETAPLKVRCGNVEGELQSDGVTYVFKDIGSLKMLVDANGDYTGAYEFTADAAGNYSLTFELTDKDGDRATAGPVRVSVGDPAQLDFTDPDGPDLHESGLPGGTEPGAPVSHSIVLGSEYSLDTSGWTAKGNVFTLVQGNFSLSYNASSKTLVYTLLSPFDHPNAAEAHEALADPALIRFKVIDSKGVSHDARIEVQVLDDAPELSVSSGYENLSGKEGEVISGRFKLSYGADGPDKDSPIAVTCNGKRGVLQEDGVTWLFEGVGTMVLSLNSSGGYTGRYTFRPLAKGEYSLVFSATDADGDSGSCGPVKVSVLAQDALDLTDASALPLEEKGLPGGSMEGAAKIDHSVTLPEGYRLDVTGWSADGDLRTTTYGAFKLTYDADSRTLTYELIKPFSHPDPDKGNELLSEPAQIPLRIIDESGVGRDAFISVNVRDDAPDLSLPSGYDHISGVLGGSASGWLEISFGADGMHPSTGLAVSCNGVAGVLQRDGLSYLFEGLGLLRMKTDAEGRLTGEYEFTPDQAGQFSLNFTAMDADGDSASSGPVTVRVRDESAVNLSKDAPNFHESGLPGGSEEGKAVTSWQTSLPEGYSLDVTGWTSQGGKHVLVQGNFRLTYDADSGLLAYELTGPFRHPDRQQAHELLDKPVEIILKLEHPIDGPRDAYISVNVHDDAPALRIPDDMRSLEGMAQTLIAGETGLSYGADGPAQSHPLLIRCNGEIGLSSDGVTFVFKNLGTLTLDRETGAFTFRALQDGDYNLVFTATDADGDAAIDSVRLTVAPFVPPPVLDLTDPIAGPLEESGLPGGSGAGKTSHSILMPDGFVVDPDKGWTETPSGSYVLFLQDGRIKLECAGSVITYTLTGGFSHSDPTTSDELLANTLRLEFGLLHPEHGAQDAVILVNVRDDGPSFSVEQGKEALSGSTDAPIEGSIALSFGGDGPADENALAVFCRDAAGRELQGVTKDGKSFAFAGIGTIVMEMANGLYTGNYTFNPIAGGEYFFQFRGWDADGDSDFVNIAVKVTGDALVDLTNYQEGPLEEAGLPAGTLAGQGRISGVTDIPQGLRIDTSGWQESAPGSGLFARTADNGRILLEYDSANGKLRYTLLSNYPHPDVGQAHEPLSQDLRLDFSLIDASGGRHAAFLLLNVLDDAPAVGCPPGYDTIRGVAGEDILGAILLNFGADGMRDNAPLLIYCNDVLGRTSDGVHYVFEGIGSLTLQIDPQSQLVGYVFKADAQQNYVLSFQAYDSEGDSGSVDVSVRVTENPPLDLTKAGAAPLEESGLAGGTNAGKGLIEDSVTLEPGYRVDTSQWTSIGQGRHTLLQHGGRIVLEYDEASRTITYRLAGAFDHPDQQSDHEALPGGLELSFAVIHDSKGVFDAFVKINVLDDAPELFVPDEAKNLWGAPGGDIEGQVRVSFGADGADPENGLAVVCVDAAGARITPSSADGVTFVFAGIGVLVMEVGQNGYTGRYVFTPEASGSYVFTFSATDADGDSRSDYVNVDVLGAGDVIITPPNAPALHESALPHGTSPDASKLSYMTMLPQGYEPDLSFWRENPDQPGQYQRLMEDNRILLTYDPASRQLSYTLLNSFSHPDPDQDHEGLASHIRLNIEVTHQTAGPGRAVLHIDVLDDAPLLSIPAGFASIRQEEGKDVEGFFRAEFGADGPGASPLTIDCNGVRGVSSDGGLSYYFYGIGSLRLLFDAQQRPTGGYVFKPNGKGDYTLTFTVFDGDGDSKSAQVAVNVWANDGLDLTDPMAAPLEERGLPQGSAPGQGKIEGSIDLRGRELDLDDWTESPAGSGTYVLQQAGGAILLIYRQGDASITYRLAGRFAHTDPTQPHELLPRDITLEFKLLDANGDSIDAFARVNVRDDAPVVTAPDGEKLLSGSVGEDFAGSFKIVFGADGAAAKDFFSVSCRTAAGAEIKGVSSDGVNYVFENIGSLTLSKGADGAYTYVFKPQAAGSYALEFSAFDAEGDKGAVTVNVEVLREGDIILTDPSADPLLESGLSWGSLPNEAATQNTVTVPQGYELNLSGWQPSQGLYTRMADGDRIALIYNPQTRELTYKLVRPYAHPDQDRADELLASGVRISLPVTHDTHGAGEAILYFNVRDDGPGLTIPSGLNSLACKEGDSVTGQFIPAFGADGPADVPMSILCNGVPGASTDGLRFTFAGLGVLELLQSGGEYTGAYVFTPAGKGSYSLTFTVYDADGDSKGAVVSVNVSDANAVDLTDPLAAPLEERGLAEGSAPGQGKIEGSIDLRGHELDLDGWTESPSGSGTYILQQAGGAILLVYRQGDASITYRLTDRFAHTDPTQPHELLPEDVTLEFKLLAANGESIDAFARVNVRDDAPVVTVPDNEKVLSGTAGEDFAGSFKIAFGADGAASKNFFSVSCRTASGAEIKGVSSDGVNYVFENIGALTLSIGAGGAYAYVFKPQAAGSYVLEFAAFDAEGDKGAATVNVEALREGDIILTDPNADPLLESGLSWGTSPNEAAIQNTVTVPQGYELNLSGWQPSQGLYTRTADGDRIALIYNPQTRELTYKLLLPYDHPDASRSDELLSDNIRLSLPVVHEVHGEREALLIFNVRDDGPDLRVPAAYKQIEGGQNDTVDGYFELYIGADGPGDPNTYFGVTCRDASGKVVRGIPRNDAIFDFEGIGTLYLAKDNGQHTGHYSFVSHVPGTYTLEFFATDRDGDTARDSAEATVIPMPALNITGSRIPELEEKGLPEGSDPSGTTFGSLDLPKGYSLITEDWTADPRYQGKLVLAQQGGKILLVYDPAEPGKIEYRLTDRFDHPNPNEAHEQLGPLKLELTLRHESLGVRNAFIQVYVRDDAPVLEVGQEHASLSGQAGESIAGLFSIAFGADGQAAEDALTVVCRGGAGAVTGQSVDGLTFVFSGVGTLVMEQAGGVYTGKYVFTAEQDGDYELEFIAKDADGDRASVKVEVSVGDISVPEWIVPEPVQDVYESGLPGGSDPGAQIAHQINLSSILPQGYDVDVSSWDNPAQNLFTIVTGGFRLTYNTAEKELRYELAAAVDHDKPGHDLEKISEIRFGLRNAGGDRMEAVLSVNVLDDAPRFGPVREVAAELGEALPGTLDLAFGADGMAKSDALVLVHNGQSYRPGADGVFTLGDGSTLAMIRDANGLFTGDFVFTAQTAGRYELALTAKDADGDTAETVLAVQAGSGAEPVGSILLEEDGDRIASIPVTQAQGVTGLSWDMANPPRLEASPDDRSPYEEVQWMIDPQEGTLLGYVEDSGGNRVPVLALYPEFGRSDPQIRAELLRPVKHRLPEGGLESEEDLLSLSFRFTAHTAQGDVRLELTVNVKDSVPQAMDDLVSISGREAEVYGNLLSGDYIVGGGQAKESGASDKPGQDGPLELVQVRLQGGVWITLMPENSDRGIPFADIADAYGNSLKVYADGEYVLNVKDATHGPIFFEYAAADKDGDRSFATLEVRADARNVVELHFPNAETLYESGLAEGSSPGATVSDFHNLAGKLPEGFDVDTRGWDESPAGVFSARIGNFNVTYRAAEKELMYELVAPFGHSGANDDELTAEILLPLANASGEGMDALIKVVVVDDAPRIDPSQDAGGPQGDIAGSIALVFGADGMHDQEPLTVTHNGTVYRLEQDGSSFKLADGSVITMAKDPQTGAFTGDYTFSYKASGRQDYNLLFTAKDGDGDTAVISVTVHAGAGPRPPAESASFAENDLPVSKVISIEQESAVEGLVWRLSNMPELYALDADGVERRVEWQTDSEHNILSGIVRSAQGEARTVVIIYDQSADHPPTIMAQLVAPVQHPGAVQGRDVLELDIPFTVKTEWGDMPVSLRMEIQDSAPSAAADSVTIAPTVESVTGDVLSGLYSVDGGASFIESGKADSLGKDEPVVVAGVRLRESGIGPDEGWVAIESGKGHAEITAGGCTLRVYANGEYVLTRGQAAPANLYFEYLLRDSDGDESRAGLAFVIEGMEPLNLTEGVDLQAQAVFEAGLPGGSSPGATVERVINLADKLVGGLTIDTTDWVEEPSGVFTYHDVNEPFILVYDQSQETLSYRLNEGMQHGSSGAGGLLDSPHTIFLPLEDADGNAREAIIQVQVRDDAPVINAGAPVNVGVGGVAELPLEVVYGGDGPAENGWLAVTCRPAGGAPVRGTLLSDGTGFAFEGIGVVTIEEGLDGYSYFFSSDIAGEYSLVFEAADADGDRSDPAEIRVTVSPPAPVGDISVTESDYAEGSLDISQDPPITSLTWHVSHLAGLGVKAQAELDGPYLPVQWESVASENMLIGYVQETPGGEKFEVLRAYGELNEEQHVRVEVYAPLQHPAPPAGQESDGSPLSLALSFTGHREGAPDLALGVTLRIADSEPVAVDDEVEITEAARSVQGNVIYGSYRRDDDAAAHESGQEDELSLDGPNVVSRARLLDANGQGDWLALDQLGPEGMRHAVIEGAWGRLEIYEDGEYSLSLLRALPNDLRIEYSLEDADGDRSSALLLFKAPLVAGDVDFTDISAPPLSESGLPGGSDQSALTEHTISLVQAMPEGFTVDTQGWAPAGSDAYSSKSSDGTFNLTYDAARGLLSYSLAEGIEHQAASGESRIELRLTDGGGNFRSGFIDVEILDDKPAPDVTGHDNLTGSVGAGIAGFVQSLFGGDGPADSGFLRVECRGPDGTPVTGQSADNVTFAFEGLGSLRMLMEGGRYTGGYVFTPSGAGRHELQFFAKDKDNDEGQSGRVVVQAQDSSPVTGSVLVDESSQAGREYVIVLALPDGVTGADWNIAAIPALKACPHGGGEYSLVTWAQDASGGLTGSVAGPGGPVTVIEFRPEFKGAESVVTVSVSGGVEHGSDRVLSLPFSLSVNAGGKQTPVSLQVDIADSAPSVIIPEGVAELSGAAGSPVSGEFILDFGADGPYGGTPAQAIGVKINGQAAALSAEHVYSLPGSGSVRLQTGPDGQYTGKYTFIPETEGEYSLVFTAKDGDEDSRDSQPVAVSVGKAVPLDINLTDENAAPLSEAAMPGATGVDPETSDPRISGEASLQGYLVDLNKGWNAVPGSPGTYTLKQGSFLLEYSEAKGSVGYTLVESHQHGEDGRDVADLRIAFAVKDGQGREGEAYIMVQVRDDVPLADVPEAKLSLSGEEGETIEGLVSLHYGADGANADAPLAVACNGVEGVLSVRGDTHVYTFGVLGSLEMQNPAAAKGEVSYSFKPAGAGNFSLLFTAMDGDGDQAASPTVSVSVSGGGEPPEPSLEQSVDLAEGYAGSWFYFKTALPEDASSIVWNMADMPALAARNPASSDGYSAVIWEKGADGALYGKAGGLTVIALEPVAGGDAGNFRVKVDGSLRHDGTDMLELPLSYHYRNAGGQEIGASVLLQVADGGPSVEAASESLVADGGAAAGVLNLDFGGDGPALSGALTANCNGNAGVLSADGASVDFADGSRLVLARDAAGYTGEYSFEPAKAGQYELRFTVTDGDGDRADSGPVLVTSLESGKLFLGQGTLDESHSLMGSAQGSSTAGLASPDLSIPVNFPDGVVSWTWNIPSLPKWKGLDEDAGEWRALEWEADKSSGALSGRVAGSYYASVIIFPDIEAGEMSIMLSGALRHGDQDDPAASDMLSALLNLTLRTSQGAVDGVFVLNIKDDAPVIENLEWAAPHAAKIGEAVEGNLGLHFGQDGPAADEALEVYRDLGQEREKASLESVDGPVYTFVFEDGSEVVLTLRESGYEGPVQPAAHFSYTPYATGEHRLVFVAKDGDGDAASSGAIPVVVAEDFHSIATLTLDEASLPDGSKHEYATGLTSADELLPPEGASSIHAVSFEGYDLETPGPLLALNKASGQYVPLTWEYGEAEVKAWAGNELALHVTFDLVTTEVSGSMHTSFRHSSAFANNYDGVDFRDAISLSLNLQVTWLSSRGEPMEPVKTSVALKIADDEPLVMVPEAQLFLQGVIGESLSGKVLIDFGADGAHPEKPVEVYCDYERGLSEDGSVFTFRSGLTVVMERGADGGYTGAYSVSADPENQEDIVSHFLQFGARDSEGDIVVGQDINCIFEPRSSGGGGFWGRSLLPQAQGAEETEADAASAAFFEKSGPSGSEPAEGQILNGNEGEGLFFSREGADGGTVFAWNAEGGERTASADSAPIPFDLHGDKLYFEDLFSSETDLQDLLTRQVVDITAEEDGRLLLTVYDQEVTLDVGQGVISEQQMCSINAGDMDEKYALLQQVLISSVGH